MNWSAVEVGEYRPAVVTVMSTVPAGWTGAVAVICVGELTVKLAAVPPKRDCRGREQIGAGDGDGGAAIGAAGRRSPVPSVGRLAV